MTFVELLDREEGEIVLRWARRVRETAPPGSREQEGLEFRASRLIREVAQTVRARLGISAREIPSVYENPARRGYLSMPLVGDSRTVVREYVLLRDVIFEVAEEHRVVPRLGDLRVLLDALASEISEEAAALAEGERELFFRTIPDMLCVASLDGHFLRVNPAFAKTLGWSDEEILRIPILDLVHPDDRERTAREIEKISSGQFTMRFENRYRTKSGDYRLLAWAASPIIERGFMYAVARDVTERRDAEHEREEFRERFVGIVAHDLRTPLASISTGAQLLARMEGVPERGVRVALRISSTAQRTAKMIADLMDFTRVRLGSGIPIERAPTDLSAIVKQVVDETDAVYPGRSVQMIAEGSLSGCWDGDRLAQVVGNLVKNALDYSPPDTPVTILLSREDETVRMDVLNRNLDGPIPTSVAPDFFEPFYKGERKSKREGLGLGLYIANEIVRAHGGSIDVRSSGEEGTSFTVRLPAKKRLRRGSFLRWPLARASGQGIRPRRHASTISRATASRSSMFRTTIT